jgi:hypothetical protein
MCAPTAHTNVWHTPLAVAGYSVGSLCTLIYYNTSSYNDAQTTYKNARAILKNYASDVKTCLFHLKIEIMRHHEQLCRSYTWGTHPSIYFPLINYKMELDAAIFHLLAGRCITLGLHHGKKIAALLYDLRHIRYLIETDTAYIQENINHKKLLFKAKLDQAIERQLE